MTSIEVTQIDLRLCLCCASLSFALSGTTANLWLASNLSQRDIR